MIILLEGVDGTGKTTLAEALSSRLGFPIYKSPVSPIQGQSVEQSQRDDLIALTAFTLADADVILDRFHPSEYAYGVAIRRDPPNKQLVEACDRLLEEHGDYLAVRLFYDKDTDPRLDGEPIERRDIDALQNAYIEYEEHSRLSWVAINAGKPINRILALIMSDIIEKRPSRDRIYMALAHDVSKRSTCLSRRTGAVLLSNDNHVIATGYNGAPTGVKHPTSCPRLEVDDYSSGAGLDMCEDVHAEENCIVQAALNGSTPRGGTLYTVMSPCNRCMRMIVNAKISEVVYEREYGDARALEKHYGVKMRRFDGRV